MSKKIIISQPWGGLGDNLQYSTLPELFSKKGYDVYISNNNKVRNNEIFDLVWKMNPYIKGVSNDLPNAGECKNKFWPPHSQNEYSMHRMEISHGFEKTNFYPKIYYTPSINENLNNVILIDLTGSSQLFEFYKYKEYIDYFVPLLVQKIKNNNLIIKIAKFKNYTVNPIFNKIYEYLKSKITDVTELEINSLIDYSDIINSIDSLIILNSGINSLAAAIKRDSLKPDILCYNVWSHFTPQEIKGCYNYKNIQYFQSKIP